MSFGFDRRDWKNPDSSSSDTDNDHNNSEQHQHERQVIRFFFSREIDDRKHGLQLYDDLRQYSIEMCFPELMENITPDMFLEFLNIGYRDYDDC